MQKARAEYFMPYTINQNPSDRKRLMASGEITVEMMLQEIMNGGELRQKMVAMALAGNIRV